MVSTASGIRTRTEEAARPERHPEHPFRLALLADFGGRASRGERRQEPRLGGATALLTDSQNIGEVMERLQVCLELPVGAVKLSLEFKEPADFQPGRVYESQALQALRKTAGEEAGPDLLRAIFRDPRFQALESAWRSVAFLLARLETGSHLRIELIDITAEELLADAVASTDLSASGLFRMLVEEAVGTPGQAAWSALVSLHPFAPREQDLLALECLAGIARIAGAPLLAGADPAFAGCPSISGTPDSDEWSQPLETPVRRRWEELRRHSAAGWIGLAMPRFLLRLPYSVANEAATFPFEEMPDPPAHEGYLWGSPAVACACLLGCAFNRHGWNFRPGKVSRLDGIPGHKYTREGISCTTAPAEVWLNEEAAERILDEGIMPLVAEMDRDSIQVARFQSIAMPPKPLAGPWD
ncbi:MAG TPA: type VI secretion system contractile sheath large subunit [Bryobacteraceae bacterium]|nr:type VI secretion system contractile sheath large subunit [Bryobacteraceae bacterium]